MNKGISSIIVAILLILITISLALAFYSWGMDISFKFKGNTETITNQAISKSKTSFFITAVSATEIGIKNNGEIPFDMDDFSVYINDTLVQTSSPMDTLGPGNVTTLNITSPFTPGNYTIKVSGPYGKYDQIFDELETMATGTTTTSSTTSSTSTSTSTTTTSILCFSGFDYRTNITIDNTANSNSLSDYQVLVTLNNANFNYSRAQPDGSDIRFTDSDKTSSLYYWIESWNYGGTSNIWVKVPNIPASSTKTIYMYYGNQSSVTSNSNGDATFEFFDDFETWGGWTKYGSGQVSQDSSYVKHGTYSLKKTTTSDPNGGIKSIGKSLGRNITLEYWNYRIDNNGGDSDRVGLVDNNGNGYGHVHTCSSNTLGVDIRSGYSGTASTTSVTHSINNWYWCVLKITETDIIAELYDESMNLLKTYTKADATYSQFTQVYVFGGYNYVVDFLRIRKYTSPEPTTSLGSEESCS